MEANNKIYSYCLILISIVGTGFLLYIGSNLIQPLLFALLFSFFLAPINKKIKKFIKVDWLTILLSFLVVITPILLLLTIFSYQLYDIVNSLPSITKSFKQGINVAIDGVLNFLPFADSSATDFISNNLDSIVSAPASIIGSGILSSTTALFNIALIFIYTFFFMYYRKSFKEFVIHQFSEENKSEVKNIILKIKETTQAYISGLGIVIVLLAVLNSLGLYLIGIEYAIFWGTLAGFLALIPYVGSGVGGLLPFLYSLATADYAWQPFAIAVYYFLIQQIEGNFITPKIVGNKVNINPLFAILSLVFLGAFWGISGVILALPLISVVRIIMLHFKQTEPLAILMGANIHEDSNRFKDISDN